MAGIKNDTTAEMRKDLIDRGLWGKHELGQIGYSGVIDARCFFLRAVTRPSDTEPKLTFDWWAKKPFEGEIISVTLPVEKIRIKRIKGVEKPIVECIFDLSKLEYPIENPFKSKAFLYAQITMSPETLEKEKGVFLKGVYLPKVLD
jgi:hypothetical protein